MSRLPPFAVLNVKIRSRALLLAVLSLAVASAMEVYAQSHIDVLDVHALPLGDGKVSMAPKRGYVYACNTQFRGGGAQHAGDWIHGSTWDATSKITVQGDVSWPDATFSISVGNGERRVVGNGLPMKHTTGVFPVSPRDPAFVIDRNPNSIHAQQMAFALPLLPTVAAAPQCVPMGMIGVALNGVAVFNALDAAGRDAVAHEVQDHCSGHPERSGQYHYHGPTACLPAATSSNALIGYALDGFGIYSMYDEHGKELTNTDLDECHGRTSRIVWNGKEVSMYHYVLTREYPYTVGCFRGTPVRAQRRMNAPDGSAQDGRPEGGGPREGAAQNSSPRNRSLEGGQPADVSSHGGPGGPEAGERGQRRPPPEAIAACSGRADAAQCQFTSPRGDSIVGTCRSPGGALACVPERR